MNPERRGWLDVGFRAAAAALLGVLLATLAYVVGIERHKPLEILGTTAVATGPGFLIFGVALVRWIDRQEPLTWKRRLEAAGMGMAAGLSILLTLMVLSAPFIGVYALLLGFRFTAPLLAGGLGVGLGCQLGSRGQRR